MTVLLIILGIVLFLFLLLLFPVHVSVTFETELGLKVRYLLFRYTVLPQPPQKAKKKAAKEAKENAEKHETKSKIREIIDQKGLSGFVSLLKEFASVAAGTAKKLFSRVTMDLLFADVVVSDEDAAQTALLYGGVCAAVCGSAAALLSIMKYKRYHINVVPDFQAKQSAVKFELRAHVIPVFLVAPLLSALFRSLKIMKSAAQVSKN